MHSIQQHEAELDELQLIYATIFKLFFTLFQILVDIVFSSEMISNLTQTKSKLQIQG